MTEIFIIKHKRKLAQVQDWHYQVTLEEIVCQIEKLKKLTSERYGAMLELMSEQQPALYGFLKNMPHMNDWAEVVGEKNDHHTLGLAMWLAYKVKFGVLPKVEDQYIGVNVSVVFEASSFSSLIQGYCGRPELWYLAYSLLPFEMFINGLEAAVKPPLHPGSWDETFRKRIWFHQNHCFSKPPTIGAPDADVDEAQRGLKRML